jgi:hypothetical protein
MIYYCIVAIFIVYYFSYVLISKKTKSRYRYILAIIPAIIVAGIFWLLIWYKHPTALLFALYGFGAVIVIGYNIVFKRKRRFLVSLLPMIPALISLCFCGWFVNVNYLNPVTCDVSEGCMNETGLIMWLSLALMVVAFIITFLTFIVDKFLIRNRTFD